MSFEHGRFHKQREELLKHERLNHPASRKQLEEVWEEEDGFKGEKFDSKTFFYYHGNLLNIVITHPLLYMCIVVLLSPYVDTNGDARLDPMELEALFYREVRMKTHRLSACFTPESLVLFLT